MNEDNRIADDLSGVAGPSREPYGPILGIAGVALAISSVLLWNMPSVSAPIRLGAWWLPLLLGVIFGVAVVTIFNIAFRREAIAISVSEVPLVIALVFVAPLPALAARLIGSTIVLGFVKRQPPFKILFNLAVFSIETVIAYRLIRVWVSVGEESSTVLVLGASSAAILASAIGSIVVAVTIARFEGDTLQRVINEVRSSWIFVVNGAAAAVMLGLALVSPTLAVLTSVPVGAMWYSLRRHGQIAQRLRDLADVYSFAGRVGRSLDLDEICTAAVTETNRLMRSASSALVLFDIGNGDQMFTVIDRGGLHQTTIAPPGWNKLTRSPNARLLNHQAAADLGLPNEGSLGGLIVAPVDDATGTIGVLAVNGRAGASDRFVEIDVSRVQNLADQLTSSVRKGMLHRQIEFEARHDGLTGLPNRNAFERQVAEVAVNRPRKLTLFVMMLDLDRFKEVNDTLGHGAGDELLIEFSRRISASLPRSAFFARLAGDEFAVLAPCNSEQQVRDIAAECVAEAGRPVTLDGISVVVTASVGIATIDADDVSAGAPMRRADIAMYNAKSTHSGIEFYQPELDRRTPARLSMLGDLRTAIECGELGVDYQPKLDLASGMVIGAEALVRWKHAIRGVVPPSDFVRVAEDTGLIKQLTDLMLSRGIATLRTFHDRGHHLGLAVNLSTHDLLDGQLPNRVAGYLATHGVDASSLTLEITESSLLIDAPRTRATIDELHQIGVRLSIDDFGTGYSSLSYLRQLPVRELKIDQSFVANVLFDEQDKVIVKSTIDLGHNLGLEVVAEGVESNEVLERLRSFGCDVAQGFCISRPLPAERFMAWLNTTGHPSRRHDPMWIENYPADEELPVEIGDGNP